jgi:hypothetical protein
VQSKVLVWKSNAQGNKNPAGLAFDNELKAIKPPTRTRKTPLESHEIAFSASGGGFMLVLIFKALIT